MRPNCKNCENRHMGCHSMCEDYIRFREAQDEVLKEKEAQRNATPDFSREKNRMIWKGMKYK